MPRESIKKQLKAYVGFVEGKLHLYEDECYEGVMRADLFAKKRSAKLHYDDVRQVTISIDA